MDSGLRTGSGRPLGHSCCNKEDLEALPPGIFCHLVSVGWDQVVISQKLSNGKVVDFGRNLHWAYESALLKEFWIQDARRFLDKFQSILNTSLNRSSFGWPTMLLSGLGWCPQLERNQRAPGGSWHFPCDSLAVSTVLSPSMSGAGIPEGRKCPLASLTRRPR